MVLFCKIIRPKRFLNFTQRSVYKHGEFCQKHIRTHAPRHNRVSTTANLHNGISLKLETGRYARMAGGAAVATLGDTSVLVTVVSKSRDSRIAGGVPLTVDYRQKYAAAGRIPMNYLRREVSRTDKEVLTSRVIDRSLRPMFPELMTTELQLFCQLMAVDGQHSPDIVSINAASAALALSDVPFRGPVGAVRVGLLNGEVLICPTQKELVESELDLIVAAGPKSNAVMLEGGSSGVQSSYLKKAIKAGIKECQHIIQAIQRLADAVGKAKIVNDNVFPSDIVDYARSLSEAQLKDIFRDFRHDKHSRDDAVSSVREEVLPKLIERFPDDHHMCHEAFSYVAKSILRNLVLDENIRCDGREADEIRPINCDVELYRPLLGSSLFQRGQTQVQCTVAFDAPEIAAAVDPLQQATGGLKDRNFLLHYTFPPFATNEFAKGPGITRREIGHGALAERALRPVIPSDHPFSILLTATVMESNGSSSMATVCGGSLALMDAGVKVSSPVSGVALGLITRHSEDGTLEAYKILTDILGIEDYAGDMDFKLAGSQLGMTALQVDLKIPGIPSNVVMEAVDKAFAANHSVLLTMAGALSQPREDKKENMPVIEEMNIPAHKRGKVTGPGRSVHKLLEARTGVELTWLAEGTLSIYAPNSQAMIAAKEEIEKLLTDHEPLLEFGAIYTANIVDIRPQGVMVTLYDDMTPALLPNSQLDAKKVLHPDALGLQVGQQIKVKYFGRDPESGQMRISRRACQITSAGLPARSLHHRNK